MIFARLTRAGAGVMAVAAGALLAAGCSTSAAHPSASASSRSPSGADIRTPALLMTGPESGYAVLQSGSSWLLVSTANGWATMANRTPIAVPTGGGLSIAAGEGQLVVGIGAYDRLLNSPVVVSRQPTQLPGPLVPTRHSVAVGPGIVTALVDRSGGTLVRRQGDTWNPVTSGASLPGRPSLDGISWASSTVGWLTGHSSTGASVAWQTRDAGTHWLPVPGSAASAAWPPCGSGRLWQIPVRSTAGRLRLLRTSDAGLHWQAGGVVTARGLTAWGCHDGIVWLSGDSASGQRLMVSSDSGASWTDRGAMPSTVTDLAPVAADTGFAVGRSGSGDQLWSVTFAETAVFRPVTLPPWLAAAGGASSGS